MENSSLGPTQIPRRLANSRSIPGKSAPPAIPCIRGGVQQCTGVGGNPRAFAKPRGVSASETENRSSLLPLGRIVISRAEKTTRVFHRRRFPEADPLSPPPPSALVIATDRKQTGSPRLSTLSSISRVQKLMAVSTKIESFEIILERDIQREDFKRDFACKYSSKYNCLVVFSREGEGDGNPDRIFHKFC